MKSKYKKDKRKNAKIKGIRNLKVTGNIMCMILPFALSAATFTGLWHVGSAIENSYDYEKNYNQYKIVSMDNYGKYKEKLEEKEYDDYIEINTRWFEENGVYVQYDYVANHDFKTKEQIEKVINSDSFDLLQKYDFKEEKKLVLEKTEDRKVDPDSKDKIFVKAGVECSEEEFENLQHPDKRAIIFSTISCILLTGLATWGYFSLFFTLTDFDILKSNISCEVETTKDKIVDKNIVNEEKRKLKQVKKKLK